MSTIIIFIQKAIAQGIGILFGATGEILTENPVILTWVFPA